MPSRSHHTVQTRQHKSVEKTHVCSKTTAYIFTFVTVNSCLLYSSFTPKRSLLFSATDNKDYHQINRVSDFQDQCRVSRPK